MCTVPRKNGVFRDSAHKGLQLLQENYINTHSYTLFLQHSYTQQLNTLKCILLYNCMLL